MTPGRSRRGSGWHGDRARFFASAAIGALSAAGLATFGCSRAPEKRPPPASSARAAPRDAAPAPRPRPLYLPDASAELPLAPTVPSPPPAAHRRCPKDMVDVLGRVCVDRYEATLVDVRTGQSLSPYYHPTADATRLAFERWPRLMPLAKTIEGRTMPVPAPPLWELEAQSFEPMAASVANVVPNGYLSGAGAELACARAGKRLCTEEEWVVACRGAKNRKFPYGDRYQEGRCNVFRGTHPARVLHGDPSVGHMDPRLNLVAEGVEPLLRPTGTTPDCKSEWGADAIYDMVGNLDEWIDDPDGTFLGGFYSRSTREGCDARIDVHGYDYYDYSLGVRCCK